MEQVDENLVSRNPAASNEGVTKVIDGHGEPIKTYQLIDLDL